jgi:hypothetical protein
MIGFNILRMMPPMVPFSVWSEKGTRVTWSRQRWSSSANPLRPEWRFSAHCVVVACSENGNLSHGRMACSWRYVMKFFKSLFRILKSMMRASLISLRKGAAFLELVPVTPEPCFDLEDEADSIISDGKQLQSSLDRPGEIWSPAQKLSAILSWCRWRTGNLGGPEPALTSLSIRERVRLKSAGQAILADLPLRPLSEIETWLRNPRAVLAPLTPTQLRQRNLEQDRTNWSAALALGTPSSLETHESPPDVISRAYQLLEVSGPQLRFAA